VGKHGDITEAVHTEELQHVARSNNMDKSRSDLNILQSVGSSRGMEQIAEISNPYLFKEPRNEHGRQENTFTDGLERRKFPKQVS